MRDIDHLTPADSGELSALAVRVQQLERQLSDEREAHHLAIQELTRCNEMYQIVSESTQDVVWIMNTRLMKWTFVTPAVEDLLGYSPEEALQIPFDAYFPENQAELLMGAIKTAIEKFINQPDHPVRLTQEFQHKRKDGSLIWTETTTTYRFNDDGDVEMIGVTRDIEDQKRKEAEVLYQATHDPLTSLLNRNAIQYLIHHLQETPDQPVVHSAILLNIDNFRLVNETVGHRGGDQLIIQLAGQLGETFSDTCDIYRYGGDEFLLLTESVDPVELNQLALKAQQIVMRQFLIAQRNIMLTCSVGLSVADQKSTLEQTIKQADLALYLSKRQRNTITIYAPEMENAQTREEILKQDIHLALERGEFELYFQPIFDIQHSLINQVEVLLRWNHRELGLISPVEFIPIAERTRLIIPMTDWIIQNTCQKLLAWEKRGLPRIAAHINISILSFENRSQELIRTIEDALQMTGISPTLLKLEVTESLLYSNVEEIIAAFTALRKLGVRLALDDFGTGYSSFGYLNDLPLDVVKLDRSLVQQIDTNARAKMVIESMITIIHGLGLEVVAEGVETHAQFDRLYQLKCDHVQGFLFSRPLPEEKFIEYHLKVSPELSAEFGTIGYLPSILIKLEWQPEWNIGEPSIDQQHHALIDHANQLINAAYDRKPDKVFLETKLNDVVVDIVDHFHFEERQLNKAGYPKLKAHAHIHRALVKAVENLRHQYSQNKLRPSVLFSYLVDDVIIGHMVEEDQKFAYLFRETSESKALADDTTDT